MATPDELEALRLENKKLAESEGKLRYLIDTAPVGVYRTTLQGEILLANQALLKMLDYPSFEEFKREGIIPKYADPHDREELIKRIKERGIVDNFETRFLARTGQTRTVLISSSSEGNTLVGMIMDITDRKTVDEALHSRLEEIEIFNKAAVGRELKMIELEQEIDGLRKELGRPPKHSK
jgi:PAS domain S-box-containing protein